MPKARLTYQGHFDALTGLMEPPCVRFFSMGADVSKWYPVTGVVASLHGLDADDVNLGPVEPGYFTHYVFMVHEEKGYIHHLDTPIVTDGGDVTIVWGPRGILKW